MPPYTKEKSAFKPPKKEKEEKSIKSIPKISEKKKAELEGRKTWTLEQFKKASKEVKKDVKLRIEKPKKTPLSDIKKDLDVIYSCVVRMEGVDVCGYGNCVSCNALHHWSSLQNGHFIKRSLAPSIIFERMNTHPQCVRCNVLLEGNRLPYSRFMDQKYGKDKVALLEHLGQRKSNLGAFEYQVMLQEYIDTFLVQCKRLNHTPTKIQQKIIDKWKH